MADENRNPPPAPGESLTARLDNQAVDPALAAEFRRALERRIDWQPAGAKEAYLFRGREGLNGLADEIVALGDDGEMRYWLLRNHWSGFPDPSEFVLVGFTAAGQVAALGYFEDWPPAWPRQQWMRDRLA